MHEREEAEARAKDAQRAAQLADPNWREEPVAPGDQNPDGPYRRAATGGVSDPYADPYGLHKKGSSSDESWIHDDVASGSSASEGKDAGASSAEGTSAAGGADASAPAGDAGAGQPADGTNVPTRFCAKCGAAVGVSDSFCPQCGAQLPR